MFVATQHSKTPEDEKPEVRDSRKSGPWKPPTRHDSQIGLIWFDFNAKALRKGHKGRKGNRTKTSNNQHRTPNIQ